MNSTIALLYPHQLFAQNPLLKICKNVILIEDELIFTQYKFHKRKLIFHRASMKAYADLLMSQGAKVTYVNAHDSISNTANLFQHLSSLGIQQVHYIDTEDYLLERRIKRYSQQYFINLSSHPSPNFIHFKEEVITFLSEQKKYHFTDFYRKQRTKFKLLLDHGGKPVGGKWTFDTENRLKLPKNIIVPSLCKITENHYIREAKKYVDLYFKNNYGETYEDFIYPVTHSDAAQWLENFLEIKFRSFGPYEDAISAEEVFLFHSVLSPMLNVGLLEPKTIINKAITTARQSDVALNSLEGFIRQVLGWREYVRGIYWLSGTKQRTINFWDHTQKIPSSFWTATTNIEPIDNTIRKTINYAYNHHIERLMVIGNFMLLCEFHPDEVYKWFMEMYIDAYDWVMVPNVYGMSQYADGGIMCTKPYISGSNYILKMSDYKNGAWAQIWDALFWRFIHNHKDYYSSNSRTSMMAHLVSAMDKTKLKNHLVVADNFLSRLYS